MVAQRQAVRKPKMEAPETRQPAREAAREALPAGWFDENGEPLVRKNPGYQYDHDFKPQDIPEGMVYQWIRHTVYGDPTESELFGMMENGWRPVPHSRHKNRFAASYLSKADEAASKGCIIRKGQLLVERPIHLNKEAQAEQKQMADRQINDVFGAKGVTLPDNVQRMGLESRQGVTNLRSRDVVQMQSDIKHDLAVDP